MELFPMPEYEVIFQPEGKRVKVTKTTSIAEAAKLAGADLISICGGKGTCGKCKIQINPKLLQQPLLESEKRILSREEIESGIRLACQVTVDKNIVIVIPELSRTGIQRLQVEGISTSVQINPFIQKYHLLLPKPTLNDSRSDADRLLTELELVYSLPRLELVYSLMQILGHFLRTSKWDITVVVWNNAKIIALEPGDTTNRNFGLSIDIGTTKLAMYLLNMNDGNVIAVDSAMNPQIPFGEDIISRINYICSNNASNNPEDLQKILVSVLNNLIATLTERFSVSPNEIYEVTAVGNTAMHHIFLNLKPCHLALAPYTPVLRNGLDLPAQTLGLNINPHANVYCLPVIAGYNGSDNIAVILSTELHKRDELCLALDIGTNTEVVLGNKDEMIVCSCASGPAFEGASIKYGMRAAGGAIEKVKIDPDTLKCNFETIDDLPPRGICGSAIVDIIAEMLKTGIIDISGKMNKSLDSKWLRQNEFFEYILAEANETAIGTDITITQKDIRQITLAKAAMHTGTVLLMNEMNVSEDDIKKVFIAGAFGNFIDIENARFIGMYPEIELSKIEVVGNAAGTGARMALLSKEIRTLAEEISAKNIKYIELAAKKSFQNVYLNSTYIPYADLAKYPIATSLLKKLGRFPQKLPHIF
ncbi:MAG: DUF4445 domain-containing protein [Promethearchaeota archaeon]|nr:MAG: DUF4445 domain-containing protein [Candidatus Lokiarchaeota archaeon]